MNLKNAVEYSKIPITLSSSTTAQESLAEACHELVGWGERDSGILTGLYKSTGSFSLEGEGWDKGDIKGCFYSPLPNPLGNCSCVALPPVSLQSSNRRGGLGRLANHCIYSTKKLCRYLCTQWVPIAVLGS